MLTDKRFVVPEDLLDIKYEAPIQIYIDEIRYEMENNILKAVQQYDVIVDKDELSKALTYDRQQYDKGYSDGVRAAFKKIREHYCSYDLDNYHYFRAVDEETIDEIYNEMVLL